MTIGISLITHYDDPEGFADDPEAFARYRELFARDVDCGASCPKCGGDADNIERGTSGTPGGGRTLQFRCLECGEHWFPRVIE